MVYIRRDERGTSPDPFLQELVNARKAKGWTQEELADLLGLKRAFVAMVETGAMKPGEETAEMWAERVGIDPRRFVGWVQSQRYGEMKETLTGMAEYRYLQDDPNVTVRVADPDQIRFESAQQELPFRGRAAEVERVSLIPEGADPDSAPVALDYVAVERELLKGERLVKAFAYRLSVEGAARVFKTLHAGDYAIVSREFRSLERGEIYAVKMQKRIVLSRIFEKTEGTLLLLSDQGQEQTDFVDSQDGETRSLIVGRVVAAIRPLQYSVVKPGGRRSD